MNKKILTCLGVIALAGAFGISAAITTNREYNTTKAITMPYELGNLEFVPKNVNDNLENLDVQVPNDSYRFIGNYTTSTGAVFSQMEISVVETQSEDYRVSRITFYSLERVDIYDHEILEAYTTYGFDSAFRGLNVVYNYDDEYGDSSYGSILLNQLWTILPLDAEGNTSLFTFDNQINYYAPFGSNIGNDYSTYSVATGHNYMYTLYSGWFKSGGLLFNKITLEYWGADGTSYNAQGDVWQGGGCYFQNMYYENTITNNMTTVNTRDYGTYTNGNAYGYYLMRSSTWRSQNYRTIELYGSPTEQDNTKLNTLNNASNFVSGFEGGSDVGLGDAFNLIGQAFIATKPILSIQVLPGISIGLLLFLPLIAGIIILIVWVVKR